ncbi:RHOMBOID-like protein 12, mitochondrial [Senna tora]|uniref:RHOMBOID-like protein 12, mitochondrial n=1 Tax=Senna tora TaxID=362788 RepID=A0A835CDS5_9FABA|nr:RHOMBOID-like protein 12, mitochondrial [Senna tora]
MALLRAHCPFWEVSWVRFRPSIRASLHVEFIQRSPQGFDQRARRRLRAEASESSISSAEIRFRSGFSFERWWMFDDIVPYRGVMSSFLNRDIIDMLGSGNDHPFPLPFLYSVLMLACLLTAVILDKMHFIQFSTIVHVYVQQVCKADETLFCFLLISPFYLSTVFNRRSWFQRLTSNDVVLGLIVANTVVFLTWRMADQKFMSENFTISLHNLKCGRLHTLITSAFSHIDTEHIFSNMIGLYFFGTSIGSTFGPQYLLKLYLAGAIGGSVFYLVHQAYKAQTSKGWRGMDISREPALGASGAVNAIMLLNIFLFPKATLYFNFFIPVPAMLLGVFLIGKDVLRMIEGDSQISGSAHLGGAAVAAIAWARIRKGRF